MPERKRERGGVTVQRVRFPLPCFSNKSWTTLRPRACVFVATKTPVFPPRLFLYFHLFQSHSLIRACTRSCKVRLSPSPSNTHGSHSLHTFSAIRAQFPGKRLFNWVDSLLLLQCERERERERTHLDRKGRCRAGAHAQTHTFFYCKNSFPPSWLLAFSLHPFLLLKFGFVWVKVYFDLAHDPCTFTILLTVHNALRCKECMYTLL